MNVSMTFAHWVAQFILFPSSSLFNTYSTDLEASREKPSPKKGVAFNSIVEVREIPHPATEARKEMQEDMIRLNRILFDFHYSIRYLNNVAYGASRWGDVKQEAVKILDKAEVVFVEHDLKELASELRNFILWTGAHLEMILDSEEAKTVQQALILSEELMKASDPNGNG
jgi:hypothetical protein